MNLVQWPKTCLQGVGDVLHVLGVNQTKPDVSIKISAAQLVLHTAFDFGQLTVMGGN